jgi:hypothetical protein
MAQRPSRPFEAMWPGECDGCGFEIEPGEMIVMWKGSPAMMTKIAVTA